MSMVVDRMEKIRIVDLTPEDDNAIRQTATVMVEGFREMAPDDWPTIDSALEEARETLAEGKISRVAVDEMGEVIGFIGGQPEYDGRVWEIHPLVVRPDLQGRGIGRALVTDFEDLVRQRGGITIRLGTDDTEAMTTLSGVDLYPNVWEHVARIRNLRGHPYEFYIKLGFVITGVVPDANGPGKPDIIMSKRVSR